MVVQLKPMVAAELVGEPLHSLAMHLFDLSACAADRMMMMRRRTEHVRRLAVLVYPRTGFALGLQQIERPVDGRDVHAPRGLLDPGADLFRRGVLERGDRLEHELALRGDPVPAGPQLVIPLLGHTQSVVTRATHSQ